MDGSLPPKRLRDRLKIPFRRPKGDQTRLLPLGTNDAASRSVTPSTQSATPVPGLDGSITDAQTKEPTAPYGVRLREQALRLLSEEQSQIIRDLIAQDDDPTQALDKTIIEAQAAKIRCEENMWTWEYRGKEVRLRDVADSVASWLFRFKEVGDVIANIDPVHVGLPWAGVRFLLEIATAASRKLGDVLLGMNHALYMCRRMDGYIKLLDVLSIPDYRPTIEESLVKLLACLLRFLADSISTYSTPTHLQVVSAVFERQPRVKFEDECDRLVQRVEDDFSMCQRNLELEDRKVIGDVLKRIQGMQSLPQVVETLLEKAIIGKLPVVFSALVDSKENEGASECLTNTRTELLKQVDSWMDTPDGEGMFWLSGMAGTGKSTIATTVARESQKNNRLGATFFFKRGEADRTTTDGVLTTIAYQLMQRLPKVKATILKTLENEPDLPTQTRKEQFEKLIYTPLHHALGSHSQDPPLVIVIDALDECADDAHTDLLVHLLFRLNKLQPRFIRVFVTSRHQDTIHRCFGKDERHRSLRLHDIEESVVSHDIGIYLRHELSEIRVERALPADWPDESTIEALVLMAKPLFIFAATICRQLRDPIWSARETLKTILRYQLEPSELERTYGPTLDRLKANQSPRRLKQLIERFRQVVGAIILLYDPLSVQCLARLLDVARDELDACISGLHPVLAIPPPQDEGRPVKLLHLSFRDYLLDPERQSHDNFCIDATSTHRMLAERCVQVLVESPLLRRNILGLTEIGKYRADVDPDLISNRIPPEIQYACRYWVYHLEKSERTIVDGDWTHKFLESKFLFWIEAMAWLGQAQDTVITIKMLQARTSATMSKQSYLFLADAYRFVLYFGQAIENTPLQLYASMLIFAPKESIIRRRFIGECFDMLDAIPQSRQTWGTELQRLEGHTGAIVFLAYSPDGKWLVSTSHDNTLRVWATTTGRMTDQMTYQPDVRVRPKFSSSSKLLALTNYDRSLHVFRLPNLQSIKHLGSDGLAITSMVFMSNDSLLATSSDDGHLKVRRVDTGVIVHEEYFKEGSLTLASSQRDRILVIGTSRGNIHVCDSESFQVILSFNIDITDFIEGTLQLEFSPDGKRLIAITNHLGSNEGSHACAVTSWEVGGWEKTWCSYDHLTRPAVMTVAQASDGSRLALYAPEGPSKVRIIDGDTGRHLHHISREQLYSRRALLLSGDALIFALAELRGLIIVSEHPIQPTKPSREAAVHLVSFSPDGTLLASASAFGVVIHDVSTGSEVQRLRSQRRVGAQAISFSLDGAWLVVKEGDLLSVFDVESGMGLYSLSIGMKPAVGIAISADGSWLSWTQSHEIDKAFDLVVRNIDLPRVDPIYTNSPFLRIGGENSSDIGVNTVQSTRTQIIAQTKTKVTYASFSPDSTLIATSIDRLPTIFRVATGERLRQFSGPGSDVELVAFSEDGAWLKVLDNSMRVQIWSVLGSEKGLAWIADCKDSIILPPNMLSSWKTAPEAQFEIGVMSTDFCALGGEQRIIWQDSWFSCKGVRVLWLPPRYSGYNKAYWDGNFAIGLWDGPEDRFGHAILLRFKKTIDLTSRIPRSTASEIVEEGLLSWK